MTRRIAQISGDSNKSGRRALITGIAGQDGSYLAELLLAKGYGVAGVVEREPSLARPNLQEIESQVTLHAIDLTNRAEVEQLIDVERPDEIYHLAAPSVVPASWDDPIATLDFMSGSVVRLLEAIAAIVPQTRFFHAASSEIFRGTGDAPQNELSPPRPTSPYGVGKLAGHSLVNAYRAHKDLFATSGILYNHESPRRPPSFVTRKIVNGAVAIKLGETDQLTLGDTSARRDWGCATDYVEAMWLMLQADTPSDYVIATGKLRTVQDLVDTVFSLLDLEAGDHVHQDPALLRKGDEALLQGDPTKIERELNWRAATTFEQMLQQMIDHELALRRAAA